MSDHNGTEQTRFDTERNLRCVISDMKQENKDLLARAEQAEAELAALRESAQSARELVDIQASNEGLWFVSQSITENYLQQALRNLHGVVESAFPPTTSPTGRE